MVISFCATKDAFFDVASNGSDLFLDDNVSGNTTLEAGDRTCYFGFFELPQACEGSLSFLKRSWSLLSFGTSYHDKGGFWGKNHIDLICRSRAWDVLAPAQSWLSESC